MAHYIPTYKLEGLRWHEDPNHKLTTNPNYKPMKPMNQATLNLASAMLYLLERDLPRAELIALLTQCIETQTQTK